MSALVLLDLVLISLLALYLLVQLLLLAGLMGYIPLELHSKPGREWPAVSILVPARNEAHQIASCIHSLKQLDYPEGKLEILIGDDQSEDETASIIQKEIAGDGRFKYLYINEQHGSAKAKANVLAHLVKAAKHSFLLVTDADIEVKPTWVKSMWPLFDKPQIGILSQATLVDGHPFFARMQHLEWLLGFGNVIAFEQLGLKSTAVGNNMAFTREAYEKSGGYAKIPFSVTEDFQLFRFINKAGFDGQTHAGFHGLNRSSAQKSLKGFLHQRKRWLIGAQELPLIWKFIFVLQGLFFPALFILLFVHLKIALLVWLMKFSIQSLFMLRMSRIVKVSPPWYLWPIFELYQQLSILFMLGFYLWPTKMNWKNRTYS